MASSMHLDVRPVPLPERHAKILSAFESLVNDQVLVIRSDHEPGPLRAELEQRISAGLRWGQRHLGEGHWEIRLSKVETPNHASPAALTLQRCEAFSNASTATLDDLAYYARRATIKRHHCVVEQGIRWPYIGIVESGVVQAQLTTPSGHQQAMYDLLPGDLFVEFALFDRGHVLLRYTALADHTVVLMLPKERIYAAAECDAGIRDGLEQTAAQHSRAILERFAAHLSLPTTARMATILLAYVGPSPGLSDALPPLPTMTQVELAIAAGTAKEVVNRSLRKLEAIGAIQRHSGRLVRLDRAKLLEAIGRA